MEASINPNRHADLFGRPLVLYDVGCRWGIAEPWMQLRPHVRIYAFDADGGECQRLRQQYAANPEVVIVDKALGAKTGRQTLYLTKELACSSLYRPDPRATQTLPEMACAVEMGTREADVVALDEWRAATAAPAPDFIKLDAQGADLDILRGGEECLKSTRAVEIEVMFNPIYIGQPLFGDVDAFLRHRGFLLWRLYNLVHYGEDTGKTQTPIPDTFYYDSRPVALPAQGGQLIWGHAYYVKEDMICGNEEADGQQRLRDSAMASLMGFRDLAETLILHHQKLKTHRPAT